METIDSGTDNTAARIRDREIRDMETQRRRDWLEWVREHQ